MTIIGYARVSTTDQDLAIQINALKAAGCEVIRSEKRSGTTTEGRAELQTVLDFLRPGDVLMVTRIDRLARSIGPAGHCAGSTGPWRVPESNGAAHRHQHRGRKMLPRYAGGICGIRDQPATGAEA